MAQAPSFALRRAPFDSIFKAFTFKDGASMSTGFQFSQYAKEDDNPNSVVPIGDVQKLNPYFSYRQGAAERRRIKILGAQVTAIIPNVFSWKSFNNRTLRVRFNGGAWNPVNLDIGKYSVVGIGSAINTYLYDNFTAWKNPIDAGLIFSANPEVNRIYIEFDPSKLSDGTGGSPTYTSLEIDMSRSPAGSDLGYTLGFEDTVFPAFGSAAGYIESTKQPRVDSQGVNGHVYASCMPRRRTRRGNEQIAFTFVTDQSESLTTIYWPAGSQETTDFAYEGEDKIDEITVWSRNGRAYEKRTLDFPILVMPLGLIINIEFKAWTS